MAIYILNAKGKHRLVSAKTPIAALLWAFAEDGFTAEALNAPELAEWLAKGLTIETAPAPVKTLVAA